MSDDEADHELLALLRQSLGLGPSSACAPPTTGVLKSAEYVYDNAIDVAISSSHTKAAAATIQQMMQEKHYSAQTWSEHELHPKAKDESTLNFIFTMDLLNFSFWSELPEDHRFAIDYRGRRWTGYWSLVAALQRALDDGIPITDPHYWQDEEQLNLTSLAHIFRPSPSSKEPIPLLSERLLMLQTAGRILYESFSCRFANVVARADSSAAALVNLLVAHFPTCFADEAHFHSRRVNFYKRAQILVADIWACFGGVPGSYGHFTDIDAGLTMFADYRIPQMLLSLGCLRYSPPLESRISRGDMIENGENVEIEMRGCSIWCVELLRREIVKRDPKTEVNAVLIDFFLYDLCKEREAQKEGEGEGEGEGLGLQHHRTRSVWY